MGCRVGFARNTVDAHRAHTYGRVVQLAIAIPPESLKIEMYNHHVEWWKLLFKRQLGGKQLDHGQPAGDNRTY